MAKTEVEAKILERLEAEAEQHAIDVVDVEVTGAGKQTVVTVRLDHADETAETITLDEVAAQTAWVSAAIDELDPFPNSYLLEVSSPGLDRPLRRPRDFERFAGEQVALVTTATEGRKRYSGELVGMRDGRVVVRCDDTEFDFAPEEVRSCKIKPTIDFSGNSGKRG